MWAFTAPRTARPVMSTQPPLDGITARVNTVPGGIETPMTIAMLLVNTLGGGVARAATGRADAGRWTR